MNGYREIAVESEVFEDCHIGTETVPFIAVGINGVYIVCEDNLSEKDTLALYEDIRKELKLREIDMFFFVEAEDGSGSFYDYTEGFVPFDDVLDAFRNCYNNHLIPEADRISLVFNSPSDYCSPISYETKISEEDEGDVYVQPVISSKYLKEIIEKLVTAEEEATVDGKYKTNPDGSMEVLKNPVKTVLGMSTILPTKPHYFPCMEEDGDAFLRKALFGGWFGLHKFKTEKYGQGIGYLLTLGCFGIFYLTDIISILTGSYNYKLLRKVDGVVENGIHYSRPVSKKWKIIGTACSIPITAIIFLVSKYVYVPLLGNISNFLFELANNSGFLESMSGQFIPM